MSDKPLLDEKLVHLKQKLEILQATYMFLFQIKQKAFFQDLLVQQIETEVGTIVNKIKIVTKEII